MHVTRINEGKLWKLKKAIELNRRKIIRIVNRLSGLFNDYFRMARGQEMIISR